MSNIQTMVMNILLNTLWQSLAVGLVGICVLLVLRHRSAAERTLTAMCFIVILAILPGVNGLWLKYAPERQPASPPTLSQSASTVTTAMITEKTRPAGNAVPESFPEAKSNRNWKEYVFTAAGPLAVIWSIGTLILLGRLFYGLIFLRGFRFGLTPVSEPKVDAALLQAGTILPLRRMPPVFTSPAATSPLTVGIFRPVMILPEKLLGSLSENEIRSIILHEFSHVWHRDHLTGVFKRVVVAANWWNPAVYFISAAHADAAEDLSDNCALLQLKPEDYSECLLQLAEKTGLISHLPATIGMAIRPGSLRQRVLNLLAKDRNINMKTTRIKKFALTVMTCGIVMLCGSAGVVFAQAKSEPTPPKAMSYWEKYQIWDVMRKGGNDYIVKDEAKNKQLLSELTKGLWLVKFKPANGFNPHNATEFLAEVNRYTEARSKTDTVGGASFFRTTITGNTLVGSFLSETPDVLKNDFDKSQTIKFISSEPVTPELFVKYVDSTQEGLPYASAEQNQTLTTVTDTFPRQGETVDAATIKEVRVTFSRNMNTSGCWAFCSDGENFFPNGDGKPHWQDKRTCVLPVKLIPGRTYSVSFNAGRFNSFIDENKRSSVPYKLIFKTAGTNAETPVAEKPTVVKTFPAHGELVNAATVKEVRVTFSEDMNTNGYWSVIPLGATAATVIPIDSKIRWQDSRTCVIPVRVEAGKEYSIGFNMGKSYRNYINVKGNSSVPYLLNFTTK